MILGVVAGIGQSILSTVLMVVQCLWELVFPLKTFFRFNVIWYGLNYMIKNAFSGHTQKGRAILNIGQVLAVRFFGRAGLLGGGTGVLLQIVL